MAEFPTYEEIAKNVAKKALDDILYQGKSIREWVKIIMEQEPRKITYEDVKGYCKPRCLTIIDNELLYELTHPKIKALEPKTDRIEYGTDGNAYKLWMSNGKEYEPSGDTVSLEAFKQVMRERDIAIEQLHELGYELGQKIEPNCLYYVIDDDGHGLCKNHRVLEQEPKSPCDLCRYNPPSSSDGKPCTMCPAEGRAE